MPCIESLVEEQQAFPEQREEPQHKTSGIQIVLLGLLLLMLYRPTPKPTGYDDSGAPPVGPYRCWAGGFDHLAAGTLTLTPDGHYESYRPNGGGSYTFLPTTSSIEFLSGDYSFWEYRGIYQRTHEVRVAPPPSAAQNNTVQTNLTLPDHPGDRIVLMPLSATDTIGTERPGAYQYCYRDAATAGLTAR